MAAHAYFTKESLQKKILVIGAGGIGCELIKNLALGGFQDIEVIDLDTIDVSNLNRQFLFRKEHVGQPKAKVAAEAALAIRPDIKVVYHHDSIYNNQFDLSYFQQFSVVLNALDNLAARRHVNRLCISGNVPLIDGGTAGFLGQVRVIQRRITECFDCVDHPVPKTFPTCTIRNTPSEMIHCITWAKYLFNQIFGEPDSDDDVSPIDENAQKSKEMETSSNGKPENGDVASAPAAKTAGTRRYAESVNYDPQKVYEQFFIRDIEYLLELEHLWKDRRPPQPFRCDDISTLSQSSVEPPSNQQWPLEKWIHEFASALPILAKRFEEANAEGRVLSWDKDDEEALRFVAACANIRAHIFHINGKSLFDVKCKIKNVCVNYVMFAAMAGNIIPAIATSNAIIAGLMVVETYKVVAQRKELFQSSFISQKPTPRGKILVNDAPVPPNAKCYVCADKREVFVKLNTDKMKQKTFVNKVIKDGFNMQAPDISEMSSGRIIVSSDEFENKPIEDKELAKLAVKHGSQLDCDDFHQQFQFTLYIINTDKFEDEEFEILLDSGSENQQKQTDTENVNSRVFADNVDGARKRMADESSNDSEKQKRARLELIERLEQFDVKNLTSNQLKSLCEQVIESFLDETVSVDENEWPPKLIPGIGSVVIKAASLSMDPVSFRSVLLNSNSSFPLGEALADAYTEKADSLVENLKTIGWRHPLLVDIDWKLCGVMESDSEVGIKEPLAEMTFTSLATNETKTEDFSFVCTKRQLQDMQWKLKEAYNFLQKMA
ncbi:UBA THIF-type NAD FAD binding fold and Ubiquitin-activating enzyme repeat domain containing protein [Aphelenchoides besseyi]|nr:UBA THIF-type NAD FAD binding fold and Ubiquitin-activating enzyme repeat domain containing protein [Aphelenchoides besseyi]